MTTKAPFTWAYFLGGGSDGGSPSTGYMSSGWFGGNISWGPGELFRTWLPRARELGAGGAYLQNPFGLASIEAPNVMEADQAILCAERLGRAWVDEWSDGLANFTAANPGWPVLVYCGGFNHPRLQALKGGAWWQRAWRAYDCWLLEQPSLASVHVGFDASWRDGADSREELFRRVVATAGATPWVEGYWDAANRWMAGRYGCITTNSQWQGHLRGNYFYKFAYRQGQRVIRCMDIDPPPGADRREFLRQFMRDCAASNHEPTLPAHLWMAEGWKVADVFNGAKP